MEWQPIETAPRDGACVALYFPNAQADFPFENYDIAHYEAFPPDHATPSSHGSFMYYNMEPEDGQPSHWCYLPDPPKS